MRPWQTSSRSADCGPGHPHAVAFLPSHGNADHLAWELLGIGLAMAAQGREDHLAWELLG